MTRFKEQGRGKKSERKGRGKEKEGRFPGVSLEIGFKSKVCVLRSISVCIRSIMNILHSNSFLFTIE